MDVVRNHKGLKILAIRDGRAKPVLEHFLVVLKLDFAFPRAVRLLYFLVDLMIVAVRDLVADHEGVIVRVVLACVNDVVRSILCVTAFHHFTDRVGDCAVRISQRQIGEDIGPFLAFHRLVIDGDGLGLDQFAVRKQTHGDVLRADAVMILRIFPDLDHRLLGRLFNEGVRHDESGGSVAGLHRIIVFRYINFLDVIRDLISLVLILLQSGPDILPAVFVVQRLVAVLRTLRHCLAVRADKLHNDRRRTHIRVIRVSPDLLDRDVDRFRHMLVRHSLSVFAVGRLRIERLVKGRRFARARADQRAGRCPVAVTVDRRVFLEGIFDLLTVLILRQLRPLRGPLVAFVQHDRILNRIAVRKQLHAHRCRTHAVLVVLIVPYLRCFEAGFFRLVRVDDLAVLIGDFIAVRYHLFDHGIGDFLAGSGIDQIKICPRVGPVPLLVRFDRHFRDGVIQRNFLAVCRSLQRQVDLRRTDAVLVVSIDPYLGDGVRGLARRVGIRQRKFIASDCRFRRCRVASLIQHAACARHAVFAHVGRFHDIVGN